MPPKRVASPSNSSPKKQKRAKTTHDQQRIDNFFLSPKKSSKLPQVIQIDSDDDDVTTPLAEVISEPGPSSTSSITHPSKVFQFTNAVTRQSPVVFAPLAVDPTTYNPDQQPSPATAVPYSFLAHTLSTLSQTRSRIAIINTLTNSLWTIMAQHPPSLLPAIYLLSNNLAPPYSPIELGLGPSIISHSIQQVSGLSTTALKRLYNNSGDIGDVAFSAKSDMRTLIPHPPLLVPFVYDSLLKIAHCKGTGAGKQKQKIVDKLLLASSGEETRYLTRTLSQNLRVGAVRTSILIALARAAVYFSQPPSLAASSPTKSKGKERSKGTTNEELSNRIAEAESLLKRVYVTHPNFDHIVDALLKTGLIDLEKHVPLTVGIPLHPTLGSPTRSLDEVYSRLGDAPFSAEFKYDGQRAQVHAFKLANGIFEVKVFSRHLEDMTDKYPDVVQLFEEIVKKDPQITSFIIDSEIVAVDQDGGLRTFQELSNRARKDVKVEEITVSVGVFAFDLMYLNGESLLGRTFRERRDALRAALPPFIPSVKQLARFAHVESCESEAGKEAVFEFWERAVSSRCEGLMIKLLDNTEITEQADKRGKIRKKPLPATYETDKRTFAWLKLKKDYVLGLGDSLDLVPIGAWHGNGRKARWWSPILLAVWDPSSGQHVAVCKCMSGFTDNFYKVISSRVITLGYLYSKKQALIERYPDSEDSETSSRKPLWGCETGGLQPEVFFKPQEVWEIRGAEYDHDLPADQLISLILPASLLSVTLSPVSVAALGMIPSAAGERGLSLRFPRFIKVREDKSVEQASTPAFLAQMYRNQQQQGDQRGVDDGELIDADHEESEGDEGSDFGD